MHDLGNVLDHLYVPSTQEDQELFEEIQIFLYSVFEEVLKTDMGKKLICDHEITNDAQKIYEKLVLHMKTSGAATSVASNLLQVITTSSFLNTKWNGTI